MRHAIRRPGAAAAFDFLFLTTAQIFDKLALDRNGLNAAFLCRLLAGLFLVATSDYLNLVMGKTSPVWAAKIIAGRL